MSSADKKSVSEGVTSSTVVSTTDADVKILMVEAEKLETRLKSHPTELTTITKLGNIYMQVHKKGRASSLVERGLKLFIDTPVSFSQGFEMVKCAIAFWQYNKYVKKDTVRVNISPERHHILSLINEALTFLSKMSDKSQADVVALKLAYVKESLGAFQDALAILSDLITRQASNGVELSFIILRAAGKPLKQYQCSEY